MGVIKINNIIYGSNLASDIIYKNTTVEEKLDTIPIFDPSDNTNIEANQYDYLTYGHIIDALNSEATNRALSAKQGKELKNYIDNIDLSYLENDISNNAGDIELLNSNLENVNSKLTNLLAEYTNKIASLEQTISTLTSNISNINSQLNNRLKLSGLTPIPNNSNLNNYTSVGNFASQSNATTKTLSNCPTSVAFCLYVTNSTGSTQMSAPTSNAYVYFLQRIVDMDGNEWTRKITYNNSTTPTIRSWVSR